MHQRNASFQVSIPDSKIRSASAVIGFDTAAWLLVERCSKRGVPLVLDQSIAHPDASIATYEAIGARFPEWSESVAPRDPAVRAAEQKEHNGATVIVAASSFSRRTLVEHGVCPEKIRINPYGVDCSRFLCRQRNGSKPMRFVFVGAIGARKGVPLLVEAWKQLSGRGAELWLVGPATPATFSLMPELPGLTYKGAMPHDEVPGILQQCDVLVFPSYFEGFGLVLLEAMACGLPVITTTATAGPDIITPGENGWVIEPGNLMELTKVMTFCLENPTLVREMGAEARRTAERFTWTAYGDRWMQILTDVCG
jgi:glycosyltransferase involved in cell wall biosynthesis